MIAELLCFEPTVFRGKGVKQMEAVTLDVGQLVLAFIAAMGIPSAIMGFVMWKLERRISKREVEAEEREKAQEKLFILIVQSSYRFGRGHGPGRPAHPRRPLQRRYARRPGLCHGHKA